MPRVQASEHQVCVWVSSDETRRWADGQEPSSGCWPCSELSGRCVFAAFDSNGIYDLEIDGVPVASRMWATMSCMRA